LKTKINRFAFSPQISGFTFLHRGHTTTTIVFDYFFSQFAVACPLKLIGCFFERGGQAGKQAILVQWKVAEGKRVQETSILFFKKNLL